MIIHCTHCGHQLGHEKWPRKCPRCDEFNYNSPKPVVNMVIRAWDPEQQRTGTIAIKRGIEPFKDGWAFPGGYIDHNEDWKVAAAREAKEELSLDIDPEDITLLQMVSKSNLLVIFATCVDRTFQPEDWADFDMTKGLNDQGQQEVLDIKVIHAEFDLSIPVHDDFWKDHCRRTHHG